METKNILKLLGENAGNLGNYINIIQNSNNNIIFFGSTGSGKTTLVNKICESSFDTSHNTQVPQIAESIRKGDFLAIDLPAYDSMEGQITKYKIHTTILSNIPIRMICFIIKYEKHYELIIDQIINLKEIFGDYLDNTLIIITQCEKSMYNKQIEERIKKVSKYNRIIYYFNSKNDESVLYDKIILYMSKMKNIPNLFIKSINLINQMKIYDYNLFNNSIDNFNKTISLFEEKLKEYENNEDVQRALFFAFKSYKNKYLRKISNPLISGVRNFSEIDKFLLELISFCKKVRNKVFDLIKSFKVGLQIGIKNDIDEGIKKCPNCGTLWTKYSGCSYIRCGSRGSNLPMMSKKVKNYIVKLFDGKIIIEEQNYISKSIDNLDKDLSNYKKNLDPSKTKFTDLNFPTNSWLLKDDEEKFNESNKNKNRSLIQPIGCTYRFVWQDAEHLTKEVTESLNYNFVKDYTDFYSDVFEIEQGLKVISIINDIKEKRINMKNAISSDNNVEDKEISYILEYFEEYENFHKNNPENLDLVLEYSSVQIDSEELKFNRNKKEFLRRIIWRLKEMGYYL